MTSFGHCSLFPVEYYKVTRIPVFFDFGIKDFLHDGLSDLLDGGVEILPRDRVFALEYVNMPCLHKQFNTR